MISIKLAFPIILEKQLPAIAKDLGVEPDYLKGFLRNTQFLGKNKDGSLQVVPITMEPGQVQKTVDPFEAYYYGGEAIIELAKSKDVSVKPLTSIELGSDIFQGTSKDVFTDLMLFADKIDNACQRAERMKTLNAPAVIAMNECRVLYELVERFEDNNHFPKSVLTSNGRPLSSLKTIGYSLVDGWDEAVHTDYDFPPEYDPIRLASLIKRAIGTDTQEKFASRASLARTYINRLAAGKPKSRPTLVTLQKIAKATDKVTENELRLACGYDPLYDEGKGEEKKRRGNLDDNQWINDNTQSFLSFLKKTIPMSAPLVSAEAFLSAFSDNFSDDNELISIDKLSEPADFHMDGSAAKVILPLRIRWFNCKRMILQFLYVALVGHYSIDKELYITGYMTAVKDLHEYVPIVRDEIDKFCSRNSVNSADIMEYPIFYTFSNMKEAYQSHRSEFLHNLDNFFYPDGQVKIRIDGIGFYLDTLSDEKFIEFMKEHKNTLASANAPEDIRDYYENVVVNGSNVEDFLVSYSDVSDIGDIIAYVMNAENPNDKHLTIFDSFGGDTDEDERNRLCITVSNKEFDDYEENDGLRRESIVAILAKYAKELGIKCGPAHHYMMVDTNDADNMGTRV